MLRIPLLASVAQACTAGYWSLPSPRSEEALSLHIFLTTFPIPSASDASVSHEWIIEGISGNQYQASKIWEVMRPRDSIKDWAPLVWFKGGITKQMFNMWIANYDRLPTRSRLAEWGLQVPTNCPFCSLLKSHVITSCSPVVTALRYGNYL